MKKKGFTLVELLAVIAILAILVIVAMPNVLGMFNQAKSSTFITEVQEYMSTATATWTGDALLSQGSSIYYGNGLSSDASIKLKELDMSGGEKFYFIEMDRNGKFKRVVVVDKNYCYDSNLADDPANPGTIKALDKFSKTQILLTDLLEVDDADLAEDTTPAGGYHAVNVTGKTTSPDPRPGLAKVAGCSGTIKAVQP